MDVVDRLWREIAARPTGPLAFRFYLQPFVATCLAMRDGVRDAHEGKPAYFWALFRAKGATERRALFRDGWHAVSRVFALAVIMDVAYQIIELRGLRPLQTLVVAGVLAFVPYLLARGPVNRLVRRVLKRRTARSLRCHRSGRRSAPGRGG